MESWFIGLVALQEDLSLSLSPCIYTEKGHLRTQRESSYLQDRKRDFFLN